MCFFIYITWYEILQDMDHFKSETYSLCSSYFTFKLMLNNMELMRRKKIIHTAD